MITAFGGAMLMSWYNAPRDETTYKRSVFATSVDGKVWSRPTVLFSNFTHQGEENGPWTTLNGRLYSQSGTQDAGLHIETIISVMRRVHVSHEDGAAGTKVSLGPIFWLNKTAPSQFEHLQLPTYLDMDQETRGDAEQYLASAVRTLTEFPDYEMTGEEGHSKKMFYNERSVYLVPGTRTLVNLLRGGGPKFIYRSTCTLPKETSALSADQAYDMTLFSCRSGVGDRFLALPEILAKFSNASEPRHCAWTPPTLSSIPDSHSRTCAAPLPHGSGIYMVGAQNPTARDPLTLSIAADGLAFDQHWAVRYGAPAVRYPGKAKCPGFQYPGAMVHDGFMYACYSIGKEDIAVSIVPMGAIGVALAGGK